jgi:hypothetical protein
MASKEYRTIYVSGDNKEDLTTVTSLVEDKGWKRGNLPVSKTGFPKSPFWITDFVIEEGELGNFTEALKNSCLPLGLKYSSMNNSRYFLLGSG